MAATPTEPGLAPRAARGAAVAGMGRSLGENEWLRFIVRRLIGFVIALVGLVVAVFFMVRLIPGDPALNVLGGEADPGALDRVRQELGLDETVVVQFRTYIEGLLAGDLGQSLRTSQPVSEIIEQRIGGSMLLAGLALAITLSVGIPLGMYIGALTQEGRRRRLDVAYQGVSQVVATVPEFLAAVVLAFVFAVQLRWLPVAGREGSSSLVLPVLALSIGAVAAMSRFVRIETANVLRQDYIRTARSAHLPWHTVYFTEVLPNVLTAALTIGGLMLASLVGGAVVVENVFALPGLGTVLSNSIQYSDYPVIQGITLTLGVIVIVVNAIVDVLLAIVDKRSLARVS